MEDDDPKQVKESAASVEPDPMGLDLEDQVGPLEIPKGFATYPRESRKIEPLNSFLWSVDIVWYSLVGLLSLASFGSGAMIGLRSLPALLISFVLAGAYVVMMLIWSWKAIYQSRKHFLWVSMSLLMGGVLVLFLSLVQSGVNLSSQWDSLVALRPIGIHLGIAGYGFFRYATWDWASARRLSGSMTRPPGRGRRR